MQTAEKSDKNQQDGTSPEVAELLAILAEKEQLLSDTQRALDNKDHIIREQQIKASERPPHPLGKCMASTSLLAHIVASKYADALPLYRLETILARYGGSVTRTAMANWIIRLDDVFKPLMNLMREHQLAGDYAGR